MSLINRLKNHPRYAELQERCERLLELAFEKVTGHLLHPSTYPLPQKPDAAERAVFALVASLKKKKQKKFTDRYASRLGLSAAQRTTIYGDLSAINLKSAVSIADQVKTQGAPAGKIFSQKEVDAWRTLLKGAAGNITQRTGAAKTRKATPRQAAPPVNKIAFVIDNLTCNKTSELRKDEIHLAGFALDAAGNQQDKAPFFVSDFKKGDSKGLGGNSQLFVLDLANDSVGGFPATLSASVFLVEEDLIHNRDLSDKLSKVCFAIYGLFMAAVTTVIIVGMAGGPVTVALAYWLIAAGLTFLIIGLQLLPFITDDVSGIATDTIVFEAPPTVGDRFDRTLSFNLRNIALDRPRGDYTATVHWEVVA